MTFEISSVKFQWEFRQRFSVDAKGLMVFRADYQITAHHEKKHTIIQAHTESLTTVELYQSEINYDENKRRHSQVSFTLEQDFLYKYRNQAEILVN